VDWSTIISKHVEISLKNECLGIRAEYLAKMGNIIPENCTLETTHMISSFFAELLQPTVSTIKSENHKDGSVAG
jgi:hypothetical protein